MEAATCAPGYQYDAGLCYKKCRTGFTGVGPVCWGQAPTLQGKKWVECGMGASTDDVTCGLIMKDQILGPLEVVAWVASAGSTGGASSSARAAQTAAKAGGKLQALKNAAKKVKTAVVDNPIVKKSMDTYNKVKNIEEVKRAEQAAATIKAADKAINAKSPTDAIRAAAELAATTGLDGGSGIAATVAAFAYDTCDTLF